MKKEDAIILAASEFWKDLSYYDRALFQLFESKLCMPFDIFHEALERVLDRPVFTHEFGLNFDGLKQEFLGEKPKPTIEEILNLIPEDKRTLLTI